MSLRRIRWFVLLLFFLSGASALVYQVLWTRMLTLVFGSTVFAISTVLTAFMAGLALGSYYFGKWADRVRHPLRLYAYFEGGIGLFALLFPLIQIALQALYVGIHRQVGASFYVLSFVRFFFALLVLLVPTTLMGATLPALSRFFAARKQQLGWDVGRLYSLNTFGAVVGTLAAAFFLVERLGVIGALYLAAFLNLLIMGAALFLDRKAEGKKRKAEGEPEGRATGQPDAQTARGASGGSPSSNAEGERRQTHVRVALIAFAVSGFCALSYEVLWTRILVFFLGSTSYAFATMLAAFLTGIALGSFVFGKVADAQSRNVAILAFVEIGIGLLAVLLLPAFNELYSIRAHFPTSRVGAFFACVSVMLLPTLLMGASFPLVTRIYTLEMRHLGTLLGRMYAFNTVGSILGSFLAGFAIIPLFGIQRGVVLVAALNVLIGLVLFAVDPEAQRRAQGITAAGGILFIALSLALVPTDRPLVLQSAIFRYENPGGKLLFYEEGVDASVTVVEDKEGVRRLYVDTNQAAEDSRWDSPSHRVIAHLPLLLHPNPRRALVVGFGMGLTSYSVTQHGTRVDAVEISPGVIHANRFFTRVNGNILQNPLLSLTIDDGRNFILTTDQRYDMISTGIIHPLVSSGSSNIYTKDFYELCKRILTPNGIMSQWVPLHRLPESHFKMILRTFMAAFPNTTLWYKYTPDFVILIGTPQPLQIDFRRFMARTQIPAIAEGLRHDDLDGLSLLDSFMMGPEELRKYVGPGPIHTDDHPRLEFFRSRDLVDTTARNIKGMQPYRTSVIPYLTNLGPEERRTLQRYFRATQRLIEGQVAYAQGRYEQAAHLFHQAQQMNPADKTIAYHLSVATRYGIEQTDVELAAVEQQLQTKLAQNPRDPETYRLLGLTYQYQQRFDKAETMLRQSLKYNPNQPDVYVSLGAVYEAQGKLDEAIRTYESLIQLAPDLPAAYGSLAAVYEQKGEIDKAIQAVKKAIELEPNLWLAHSTLGGLYQQKGEHEKAIQAFQRAASLAPDQPRPAYGLAISYQALGRTREALKQLEKAARGDYAPAMAALARWYLERGERLNRVIELANALLRQDPDSAEAYDLLALAYATQGDRARALEMIREAIRRDPETPMYRNHQRMIEGSR